MRVIDSGGGYSCVGCIWEIIVPPPEFSCEPETALKNKVLIKSKQANKTKPQYGTGTKTDIQTNGIEERDQK